MKECQTQINTVTGGKHQKAQDGSQKHSADGFEWAMTHKEIIS
jgi:hypothetical protein